jgi:hypothetical protein
MRKLNDISLIKILTTYFKPLFFFKKYVFNFFNS